MRTLNPNAPTCQPTRPYWRWCWYYKPTGHPYPLGYGLAKFMPPAWPCRAVPAPQGVLAWVPLYRRLALYYEPGPPQPQQLPWCAAYQQRYYLGLVPPINLVSAAY